MRSVTTNRKAYHDFFVEEKCEAGLVLKGTEIKSIRNGKVNLKDSFARIENGELFVYHIHISHYEQGNRFNVDPERRRKLLLHRHEINKLIGKIKGKGMSLVPLKLYIKKSHAKIELGLVKGKKLYDKRREIAKKDSNRLKEIEVKEHLRKMAK